MNSMEIFTNPFGFRLGRVFSSSRLNSGSLSLDGSRGNLSL